MRLIASPHPLIPQYRNRYIKNIIKLVRTCAYSCTEQSEAEYSGSEHSVYPLKDPLRVLCPVPGIFVHKKGIYHDLDGSLTGVPAGFSYCHDKCGNIT